MIDMKDSTSVGDVLRYVEGKMQEIMYCIRIAEKNQQKEKIAALEAKLEELDKQRYWLLVAFADFEKHMESLSKNICDN
ncbi:MAG: hypothetical protein GX306_13170 [Clostridiales bacterium]|jgi:hypothetical protein|nr:hypothetical protein [Clostridiales bacterium]NLZ34166.1 hypothetical protein [Clostridiales bacterium]